MIFNLLLCDIDVGIYYIHFKTTLDDISTIFYKLSIVSLTLGETFDKNNACISLKE